MVHILVSRMQRDTEKGSSTPTRLQLDECLKLVEDFLLLEVGAWHKQKLHHHLFKLEEYDILWIPIR